MPDDVALLLVEDDPLTREDLASALHEAGLHVAEVTSGAAAVAMIEDMPQRFQALVTSIHIGQGPTGWELARRFREKQPSLPVVYISGTDRAEWLTNGVPHSVFIEKPFVPAQVITAVTQLLNKAQVE